MFGPGKGHIMKITIMAIVGLVSVGLIGLVFAGCHPRGGGGRFFGPPGYWTPEKKVNYIKEKITEKLDLSEDQISTLDRIGNEMMAKREQMQTEREAFRSQFMDELRKESVDPAALKSLFQSKLPVIEDFMSMAAENIAEFHSILTPEQREKLVSEIESHHNRCPFGK